MQQTMPADPRRLDSPWAHPTSEVIEAYGSDAEHGLSQAEARRRLEESGPNRVEAKRGPGAVVRFLLQFHQPLIYILVAAGIVTLLLGEYVDSAVIFGVVVLNALFGYVQESRALAALAALADTLAAEATVIRDGDRHRIQASEVVPGDLVVVEAGDKVPADLRLVAVRELQVDEAAITGESAPVGKHADPVDAELALADRSNMAYSSTLATYGRATGIVVATGSRTEVGRISELIESAEDVGTPLTRRIAWFSRVLLVAILALASATFAVGLLHEMPAAEAFLAAVALAVAAIPEGLPAVITITLAIGVSRMARRRAIIRRLPAVETLGSTTVVCSDKTGTLTENQMTVRSIWAGDHTYSVSGVGYQPDGAVTPEAEAAEDAAPEENAALQRCLLAGLLCNDASLEEEDGRWSIRGDPTEGALIVVAQKAGLLARESEDRLPRLDAVPFESEQQYMATLHRGQGDTNAVFVKGADEAIIRRCANRMSADGGLVDLDADEVLRQVQRMAEQGLRVLAFASRDVPRDARDLGHDDVDELTFLGVQGMIDPPREEAIRSVRACKGAGIIVKMITGDHGVTAGAIAQQLAIGESGLEPPSEAPRVITGAELERLSDDDLYEVADEVDVFARIPPEGKLRLVRALQSRGHIVGMTGDGVNDGPALRQADIGVAMGITGTEVAREAGDMVLTDDNFASIEAAIEEGRGVFDNLTKFLTFVLPTNLGESMVVLLAVAFGTTLPMLPVQVLWVNMTTAVLLGLALAFEPREPGIMERPPRRTDAPLITRAMVMRMLLVSAFLLGGSFGLFSWSMRVGAPVEEARTAVVNLFIAVEIAYLLNCRSLTRSMFAIGVLSNWWVVYGITAMILVQLAFTYVPALQALFQTAPISLEAWLAIAGIGVATYVAVELEKYVRMLAGRPATHDLEPGGHE